MPKNHGERELRTLFTMIFFTKIAKECKKAQLDFMTFNNIIDRIHIDIGKLYINIFINTMFFGILHINKGER